MSELSASSAACPHVPETLHREPGQPETASAVESACDELVRTRLENAQLKEALRARTVIGQATGLLMARLNLDPDEAFAELAKMSSHAQCKLRDVAVKVVATAMGSTECDSVRQTELPDVASCAIGPAWQHDTAKGAKTEGTRSGRRKRRRMTSREVATGSLRRALKGRGPGHAGIRADRSRADEARRHQAPVEWR